MARDRRKKSGDSVKSQQKDTKDIKERRKKTTQGTERNYQTHECHNKTSSPSSSASSSSQDSRFCAKTDRRFLLDKLLPGKKKKESQLALLSEQQRAVRQEKLKQQRNRTAGKRGDDEENEASSCRGEEEEGDKKKNWNRGGVSPFRSSLQVSDWQNDERFARIFTDESFAVGGGGTGKVDKFGRKLDKKQGSEKTKKKQKGEEQEKKKVVEKRTSVGEDDEGDEEEELAQKNKVGEKEKRMQKKKAPSKAIEEEDEEEEGDAGDAAGSEDEAEEEENEEDEEAQEEEEVEEDHESTETSSTSSESEEDEDEEEEEGPSVWDQEGDGLVMGEEASRRLAVMGLEWENISADDLLLLFRSFVRDFLSSSSGAGLNGVSTGGEGEDKKKKGEAEGGWGKNTPEDIVRSVKIYPSDFGLKRMEIEAVKGPCIDWASVERGRRSSEGEEDESGEDEEAEADESGEEESEEQGEEEEESEGGEAEGKQEAAADDHDDEPSGEDEDKEESEASEQENEQDDEANEEEGGGREQGMYVDSDTDVDDDDDLKPTEEEERLYNEALRKYEKERSQYYYAVVEFNSVASAKFFYDELDGCDISFAVDGLDLRFIPDELEFPHEPTSVSTLGSSEKAAAALLRYEPPPSMSTALRHSRVKCTWDENPAERTKLLRKKFTEKELRELDLQAYLASSSSEEEDDEEEDEAAAENSKTMGGGRKRWKVTEENLQEYRRQLLGDAADLSTDDEDDEEDYDISRKSDVKDNGKASGASSGIVISFDGELETLDQQSSREANEDFIIKEKKPRGITQADEEAWDNYVREKKKKEKQIQKREQKKFEAMRLREEEEGDEEEDEEKRSSLGETKGRKKETRKFPLFSSGTGGEDDEGTSDPESATLVNGESKKKKLQRSKRRAESTTERPQLSGNEAAELELLTLGHEEDARRHFDLRAELHDGKKKKRKLDRRCGRNEAENPSEKAEAEASFKVDVEDSRFSRLFSDPDFAIDPTNPHFKRTAATEELLKEKRMRSSQQKLAAFKQPPHDVLRSQQAKNTTVQKRKGGDVVSTERCSVDTGAGTLEKETEAKKKKTKTGNFSLFASKKCEAL